MSTNENIKTIKNILKSSINILNIKSNQLTNDILKKVDGIKKMSNDKITQISQNMSSKIDKK